MCLWNMGVCIMQSIFNMPNAQNVKLQAHLCNLHVYIKLTIQGNMFGRMLQLFEFSGYSTQALSALKETGCTVLCITAFHSSSSDVMKL